MRPSKYWKYCLNWHLISLHYSVETASVSLLYVQVMFVCHCLCVVCSIKILCLDCRVRGFSFLRTTYTVVIRFESAEICWTLGAAKHDIQQTTNHFRTDIGVISPFETRNVNKTSDCKRTYGKYFIVVVGKKFARKIEIIAGIDQFKFYYRRCISYSCSVEI